jgi:alkyl hydroperoxide reductase subunit AhpC
MQMAVHKYKDNSDVKFLFIDTRENDKTYKKLVQDYLTQTKYPFHVLFDDVSKSGKQSKIAEAYQGLELPTRFIVDKKGYIRFKELGFENVGNEIAVQKLATMIELASAN